MTDIVKAARFKCRHRTWEVELLADARVVLYVHPTGSDDYQGREPSGSGRWDAAHERVDLDAPDPDLARAATDALRRS
jgi:hypothetical protein